MSETHMTKQPPETIMDDVKLPAQTLWDTEDDPLVFDADETLLATCRDVKVRDAVIQALNSHDRLVECLGKVLGRLEDALKLDPPGDWHCVGLAADDIRALIKENGYE